MVHNGHGHYLCEMCKNDTFKISLNSYPETTLSNNHLEIFCTKCNRGKVVVSKEGECLIDIEKYDEKP